MMRDLLLSLHFVSVEGYPEGRGDARREEAGSGEEDGHGLKYGK
jgi:hypothetical protein